MSWKIGQAKQRLSEVIMRAASGPQLIYNRERPVAAVIAAEQVRQFVDWLAQSGKPSIADRLAEAQQICAEEDYEMVVPTRVDRENPLAPARVRRVPRRHQRR